MELRTQPEKTAQDHDAAVAKAKAALQKGQVRDAASAAEALLAEAPDDLDGLYILAVAQRYLKQPGEALKTLDRLKTAHPAYGRAYQEVGHVLRAQGDTGAAISAFERAVNLNPALQASWQALSELHKAAGDETGAERCGRQAARLGALPRELVSVTSFLHEGKLFKAEQLCRAFLQKTPHHVEAMRLLAEIGMRLHVLDDAEFLLESCVTFAPDNLHARLDYVTVLNRRQKYEKALEEAATLRDRDPGNPVFETALANQNLAVGRFDEALTLFDQVLDVLPDNPTTLLSKGHALKTVGRQEDAVSAYRSAFRVRSDFGDAFWSLANLKTYRFTDEEMNRMREAEDTPGIQLADRYHLCFALGKALEDRQEYQQAFACYERGNALKKAELRYSADRMARELQTQADICTPDLFNKHQGVGAQAPDPIFVVGLPRAGSTLLEQILASHSQVDGTLELPNILALAHRLNGRRRIDEEARYPGILHDLTAEKLQAFGEDYIEQTRIYRKGAPFFTDKMPNNFRHIGLIRLILPNAKIIDARRHPLACSFSCFKQLFAEGQEFTYGLEDVGRYYKGYVDLMDHWDRVLPGHVLRVQYEDVVADLEGQVRRLLEFCGLPFEEACIQFHKTDRSVRTASSEQVRRPLNTDGLDQWRNFDPWLGPLRDTLGDLI